MTSSNLDVVVVVVDVEAVGRLAMGSDEASFGCMMMRPGHLKTPLKKVILNCKITL